jgi:hypothetical protein
MLPHANDPGPSPDPASIVQAPVWSNWAPAIWRRQSFSYVLPSQPQTGAAAISIAQFAGLTMHVPPAVLVVQRPG